ncbi:hypothetical protein EIN_224290 [Entamoeba invadens IP1]|uniref:Chorein N-terminal domain-containing protein n=1 Tax=Entamoeba invadens IP1 TaxID=370355 RepID=A0A0A1U287_ENTIV|nr:hypothetical protein EIN_224290 [Entamoeba invadens IP1]ELP88186.1 hypothetical protein EIN_224290 [Entamoeba invadens IP1]|eukprot:XP_004254957.1 hypothetical protein EIN_224290 [Entamoeba invadens IP1]
MFESIVSDLLMRYFGKYISGLNSQNLQVSLWAGDVTLENLVINENAFSYLLVGVPLKVIKGTVGKMSLHLPWNKLNSQPVVVQIKDVTIVVTTDYSVDASVVASQLEDEEQASKQRQLRNYEISSDKSTMTQRLFTKILNNMQIDMSNIHVRYEAVNTWTGLRYAIGTSIESIKLYSTDEKWNSTFVIDATGVNYKIAEVVKMRVYHCQTKEDKFDDLKTSLPKSSILEDLTTKMKLTLSDKDEDFPVLAKVLLEVIKVNVTQDVLIDAKSLMQQQKLFEGKCSQSTRNILRPSEAVSAETAKKWWVFAKESILAEVRKKRYKESDEYKKKRKTERQEYTDIYTRVLNDTPTETDKQRFAELEKDLSVKEIIYLRNYAKTETDEAKKNTNGIWSWMGYSAEVNSQLSEDIHTFLGASDDEDFIDTKKLKQLLFSVEINKVCLGLFGKGSADAFVSSEICGVVCSVEKKTIGFTANGVVGDFLVKSTTDKKYPNIFQATNKAEKLFEIKLTSEKEDEKTTSDFVVEIQLRPTRIVYNKVMVEELMNVLRALDIVETYGQVGISLPSVNIKSILDEHIRVTASATIHTPYIIIHSGEQEIHVDLGIIEVKTCERTGIYDTYKASITNINCKLVSNEKAEVLLEKTALNFEVQKSLLSWKEMKNKMGTFSPGVIVNCCFDEIKSHISAEQMETMEMMFKEQKPQPKSEKEAIQDLLNTDDSEELGEDNIQIPEDFVKFQIFLKIPTLSALISQKTDELLFDIKAKGLEMTSLVKDTKTSADFNFSDVVVTDENGNVFFSKKQTSEALVSMSFLNEDDKPIKAVFRASQSIIRFDLPHLDHILHFIYTSPQQNTQQVVVNKKKQKVVEVQIQFTAIDLELKNRGTPLGHGSAVGGLIDIIIDNNKDVTPDITVKGSFKEIFAIDDTLSGKVYPKLAQTGTTPFKFIYTHSSEAKAIEQRFKHYMLLEAEHVTFVYLNLFIQQIYSWLLDLLHICSVRVFPSNTPSYQYDRLNLEAKVRDVTLTIPVASYSDEAIDMKIDSLALQSTWEEQILSTKSLSVENVRFDDKPAAEKVVFDFTFPDDENQAVDFPAWEINLKIPNGNIDLTPERYRELVGLIMINLDEPNKHQDLIKYHPDMTVNAKELNSIRSRVFTADVDKAELNIKSKEDDLGVMSFDNMKYKYIGLPSDCSNHIVDVQNGVFIDLLNNKQKLFWVDQNAGNNFLKFTFDTLATEKKITLAFGNSSNIRLTQETLLKLMTFFGVEKKYMTVENVGVSVQRILEDKTFTFKFLMNGINFILNDKEGDFTTFTLSKSFVETVSRGEDTKVSGTIGTLTAKAEEVTILSTLNNVDMGTFSYSYEKAKCLSVFTGQLSQIHAIFNDKAIIRAAQYYDNASKIMSALKGKTVEFIEKTASVSRKIRFDFVIETPRIDIRDVTARLGVVTIKDKAEALEEKLNIIGLLRDTEVKIGEDIVVKCDGVEMGISVNDASDGVTDVDMDVDCGVIDICTTPQNLTSLLNVADAVIKTSQQITNGNK